VTHRHLPQSGTIPGSGPARKPARTQLRIRSALRSYALFLEKEILPKSPRSTPPQGTPMAEPVGISSGGILCLTAAWTARSFSRNPSHVGSFTNIRGGDV